MRVLMVSPFPPLRDGVGKYAAQEVQALREQGHAVEVLAPVPCAAHHVENLRGGLRMLALRKYARGYDRVVLQYQPSHFHTHFSGLRRLTSNVGMALTFALVRNMTVVCHEIEYPPEHWRTWRPERVAERLAWTLAREVAFHTEREVDEMRHRLGARPRSVVMRRHGEHFRSAVSEDRATARRRLGLDPDVHLFLCIGFVQRHKGFDRAVRALRSVPGEDVRLFIVGSVRDLSPEHQEYVDELRRLAADDPRVQIRLEAPSDEEFDRWIVASDTVVLPYREIWSSGVVERAKLLGRRMIVTDVGGLREQVQPADTVVASDRELAIAIAHAAGRDHVEAPTGTEGPHTPQEAAAYVRREAARRRGRAPQDAQAGPSRNELLESLSRSRGAEPVVWPSTRRVVGPALTFTKRVARRGLGWYIWPILTQVNDFEDRTYEAVAELYARIGHLVSAVETIQRRLESDMADRSRRDDHLRSAMDEVVRRIDALGARVEVAVKRVDQVERRTRGIAELVERRPAAAERDREPSAATSDPAAYTALDYHRFEGRYRGDPEIIKRDQRDKYLKDFDGRAPVVDVGCGRGEFLEVLRDAGIEARGVDVDLDMVVDCRAKGLDVHHGDGIAYLRSLEPASVGGVIASQVVEHLPPRGIVAFLAAARNALRSGGVVVCETINPGSLYALANWYTMDLTHAQPVHPNTLAFLAEQEGFSGIEVRYLSPVRDEPPTIGLGGDAPEWARTLVTGITEELRRLDATVFGPQDYALVAVAP